MIPIVGLNLTNDPSDSSASATKSLVLLML